MTCKSGIFPRITSIIADLLVDNDFLNYGQKYHFNWGVTISVTFSL